MPSRSNLIPGLCAVLRYELANGSVVELREGTGPVPPGTPTETVDIVSAWCPNGESAATELNDEAHQALLAEFAQYSPRPATVTALDKSWSLRAIAVTAAPNAVIAAATRRFDQLAHWRFPVFPNSPPSHIGIVETGGATQVVPVQTTLLPGWPCPWKDTNEVCVIPVPHSAVAANGIARYRSLRAALRRSGPCGPCGVTKDDRTPAVDNGPDTLFRRVPPAVLVRAHITTKVPWSGREPHDPADLLRTPISGDAWEVTDFEDLPPALTTRSTGVRAAPNPKPKLNKSTPGVWVAGTIEVVVRRLGTTKPDDVHRALPPEIGSAHLTNIRAPGRPRQPQPGYTQPALRPLTPTTEPSLDPPTFVLHAGSVTYAARHSDESDDKPWTIERHERKARITLPFRYADLLDIVTALEDVAREAGASTPAVALKQARRRDGFASFPLARGGDVFVVRTRNDEFSVLAQLDRNPSRLELLQAGPDVGLLLWGVAYNTPDVCVTRVANRNGWGQT